MNLEFFHVTLKAVFIIFHFLLLTNAVNQRYQRGDSVSGKNSVTIIEEKCDEYAAARYHNVTVPGVLKGDNSLLIRELDCVQEYPQKTGVHPAKEKEYPHLALIGSSDEKLENAEWYGSGSLISDLFILGAASGDKKANWAALGLLNKSSITADKLNKNVFKITQIFIHPEYKANSARNDIALFKLESPVIFTSTIRPLCLHTSNEISSFVQNQATVVGWGAVDSDEPENDVLKKGKIDFIEPGQCIKKYANDDKVGRDGYDNESMICAGNLIEHDITCVAQNGGPLQVPIPFKPCMWSQVGITAYGSSICGDDIHTLYTKVSHYSDWIQNIVWPQL